MSESPTPTTQLTPYDVIGGEPGVRALVDRFYDLMDLEPRYIDLRAMHPSTLQSSRDKLFMFLSGWLGGPPLFEQNIGHPMLRARHLPFSIGVKERNEWLACMFQAMQELGVDASLQRRLEESFAGTADWMRNRAEPGHPVP